MTPQAGALRRPRAREPEEPPQRSLGAIPKRPRVLPGHGHAAIASTSGAPARRPADSSTAQRQGTGASHLKTCREHYAEVMANRCANVTFAPHQGPSRIRVPGERFPRRLNGCRFGNLKSIPSSRDLDPPSYCCFNCGMDCKKNPEHHVLYCDQPYLTHCENCGRRGGPCHG